MKTIIQKEKLHQIAGIHQSRYEFIRMKILKKRKERKGGSRRSDDHRETQHQATADTVFIRYRQGM